MFIVVLCNRFKLHRSGENEDRCADRLFVGAKSIRESAWSAT
ncbi:17810_t:CDS:2 [Entrophospora sp. SA101]|nr:17810_t:CDS:2 [Entrophospora sp. SA101]